MDNIVYKHKGSLQNKPADSLEIGDGLTLGELIDEIELLKEELELVHGEFKMLKSVYEHLITELSNKYILESGKEYILQLDDKLTRGKIGAVFPDKGEELRFYKVSNNQLVKDKKKILEVME
jgi:hypothetical protein